MAIALFGTMSDLERGTEIRIASGLPAANLLFLAVWLLFTALAFEQAVVQENVPLGLTTAALLVSMGFVLLLLGNTRESDTLLAALNSALETRGLPSEAPAPAAPAPAEPSSAPSAPSDDLMPVHRELYDEQIAP